MAKPGSKTYRRFKFKPLLSLIVPAYNRWSLLERCLQSLRCQQHADFEILVVDDGSEVPLTAVLQAWQRYWSRLHWLRHAQNRGRAASRNTGLQQARGQWVIFLDSDMAVSPDFVQQHWQFHLQHGPGWIGQGQIIGTQDPDQQPIASLWTDASRASFATGNVSVERQILLELAGFDESFTEYGWEDLELGLRLQAQGYRAGRVKTAAYHYEPLPANTLSQWQQDLERAEASGRGAALMLSKHPQMVVRLMTQLTPLHRVVDQSLFRWLPKAQYLKSVHYLMGVQPKLGLALYRLLLNHYALQSAHQAWQKMTSGK